MARTPILRSHRLPCLMHVELLENRCLLTGQLPWPAAPLTLTPSLGSIAVVAEPAAPVTEPVALVLAPNDSTTAASSDPAPNDSSSSNDGPAESGTDASVILTDPSLSQADPGQAVSDGNAGGSDDASSSTANGLDQSGTDLSANISDGGSAQADTEQTASDGSTAGTDQNAGDTVTGQLQGSSVTADAGQIQAVPDPIASSGNSITGQSVAAVPVQNIAGDSLTIIPVDLNNQQGGDSGTGTGGSDAGSSGSYSGTITGGDQSVSNTISQSAAATANMDLGMGMNPHTSHANTMSSTADALTQVMGPDPAPTAPRHSSGGTLADTGSNPSANPNDSGPATPPVPTLPSKLPQDSAPRLPWALVPMVGATTAQRITTGLDASGHVESIHLADAHNTAESSNERQEGPKGSFIVAEPAPPTGEAGGPVVLAQEASSGSQEVSDEPVDGAALVRALPASGGMLLATAAPFDLPALEKGVHGFFAQLEQMSEQIVAAQDRSGVGTWVVALATAGVALELARRKLRPATSDSEAAEGGPDATWNWLLAPDPG